MPPKSKLRDGDRCRVIGGTHAGKSGTVHDIKTSKTGHVTVTIKQKNGECFKTLARMLRSSQSCREGGLSRARGYSVVS
jgi:ribosomal protein S4E